MDRFPLTRVASMFRYASVKLARMATADTDLTATA
jgi:hypothetical protein